MKFSLHESFTDISLQVISLHEIVTHWGCYFVYLYYTVFNPILACKYIHIFQFASDFNT